MKEVKMSAYLDKIKPLAKKVVEELGARYDYVSLLGADSIGKVYSVKKTGGVLRDSNWVERGFVIRVYSGSTYVEHSFNELNDATVKSIVQTVDKNVENLKKLQKQHNVSTMNYGVIEEEVIEENFLAKVAYPLEAISHEEKLAKMNKVMAQALAMDKALVDVRVSYEEVHISKIFLSSNKHLSQSYIWSNAAVIPIAYGDGQYKYTHTSASGLQGADLLDELDNIYEKAVKDTISLIGSTPVEPGEYDIILDPDMAGLVAHEAFGHGVEMDMFVKNRAKAMEYMDKRVASDYVNMYDGATAYQEVSSYLFDDEGNLGTSTKVIDEGILRMGIADALSAMALNVKPTGNGKRQNYEHKVYTRMTNTFFEKGEHSLEEMIKSIDKGYLVEGFFSGMEDPKNWGIQCIGALAREIVDGALTGKVHSPIYLTGYVPDLLNSISMTSDYFEIMGNGTCGKGYKEFVKTSTGGPYIKAKGRLS